MKVLFLGTSGVHHPLVAANLFTGRFLSHDLRMIKGFCDSYYDESGDPIYVAEDSSGNEVYALGVGSEVEVGQRSIEGLRELLGCTSQDLVVKSIFLPGEKVMYYMNKIPKSLGGKHINMFVSNIIIKRNFKQIKKLVDDLQAEILVH
ncbi:MAG TPA: DUF3189 family protein [Syntrophomonadaceae bacterium]|nr:DUF3189 family protein [Syntrophomonadaceae bacterium]